MAKKSKKKKNKKSFQQELRERQPKPVPERGTQQIVIKDDLDTSTRIGFILMSYLLFIVGSFACVIIGFAGRDKRGSSEVIIIGLSAFFLRIYSLFLPFNTIFTFMKRPHNFIYLLVLTTNWLLNF